MKNLKITFNHSRKLLGAIAVFVFALSCSTEAQFITPIPVLEFDKQQGFGLDAGTTHGDYVDYCGARASFFLSSDLELFANGGVTKTDYKADGTAFGGGAMLKIPVASFLMLGIRGEYNKVALDRDIKDSESDILSSAFFVAGTIPHVPGLTVNARISIHRWDDYEDGADASIVDDETEFGIGAGVIYEIAPGFAVFGGVDTAFESRIGGGIRITR